MKRLFALITTLLLAFSLIGCGAKSSYEYAAEKAEMPMAVAETAAVDYGAGANGYYAEAEEAAAADITAANGTTSVDNPNRKLIKNVYLTLQTKELAKTTTAIQEKVAALGGYIQNTSYNMPDVYSSYRSGGSAYFTCRIPSNKLDEFVKEVEGAGNVTYKTEDVTDITLQYADTESRKSALKVEQQRLEELMKKAESVEDLITIESRMSEVRYELESIESQLRTYDNQVDYSTVNIDVQEVVEYTAPKKGTVGERIAEGLKENLADIGIFLEDATVWFVTNIPTFLLLAVFAIIIILIIKGIKKLVNKFCPKYAEKKAKKAADKAAKKAEKAAAKAAKKAEKLEAKTKENADVKAEDING